MKASFDTDTSIPESMFSAQDEKLDTTIETLEAMKDDMTDNAIEKADVDAVIKMVKVYKAMH